MSGAHADTLTRHAQHTGTPGRHRAPVPPQVLQRRQRRKGSAVLAGLTAVIGGAAALLALAIPGAPARIVPAAKLVPAQVIIHPRPAARPAAQPSGVRTYSVQPGDTLWSIAAAKCQDAADWSALAQANHFGQSSLLKKGEVIVLSC
jgi:nucleoid-associated protein YgaU